MSELKKVLMERDGLSDREADTEIAIARQELLDRLERGEMMDAMEICEDMFGLEPDYLEDLM